ncbi:MAG TPA: PAS domain S-box protein, partial [Candidatus Acidoferrum sp.]|nr:PAS domain S-box protein [Candidatus Acidoferrum sp.]
MNLPEDRNIPDSDLSGLREEVRKYQTLIDANGVGYVILDENGCVLDANSQYVSFSGHQQVTEILGRNISEWTLNSERESMRQAIVDCLARGSVRNCRTKYVGKNGLIATIAMVMVKHAHNGGTRLMALCHNITPHVQAEESAQRERGFTDAVLESAPFLVYEYDDRLKLVRWNKRSEEVSGYSAEELANLHLFEWFSEEDIPRITNALENIRDTGYVALEANIRTKDGRWVPYYCTAVSLMVDGKQFFTGIAVDLSEQKRFEQALHTSEARLRQFITNSQDGIVIVDRNGRVQEWNKAEERITGIPRGEAIDQPLWDLQLRLCPPELRNPDFVETAKRRLLGGLAEGDSLLRLIEEPIIRPDGVRCTLQTTIFASTTGDQLWAGGITRDITEQKRTEVILRQSEERLRTLIEEAPLPIGYSRAGKMLYANTRYLRMVRAERIDQIIGYPIIEQFAPQSRVQVTEYLHKHEQGMPVPSEYEVTGLRFDGTQFPVHVAVTRVQLADGPVTLAFATDITDRIKARDIIKAERDRARQYLQVVEVVIISLDRKGTITLVN